MFDIGWSELLVIGIVALVVIGPKDLPKVLRTVGQMMTKVRRMASEFQGQFQEAMREAELADLKKQAEGLMETATSANPLNQFEKIGEDLQQALEKPIEPATTDPGAIAAEPEPTPEQIGAGQMPPVAAAAPVVPPELEQPAVAAEPQPRTPEDKGG
jgi:sec-independent protein translocase protein TatB